MTKLFSYNIAKNANQEVFKNACGSIKSKIKDIREEYQLVDVDGTQIQIYSTADGKIKIYNDYEVDAVYVESEINLQNVI